LYGSNHKAQSVITVWLLRWIVRGSKVLARCWPMSWQNWQERSWGLCISGEKDVICVTRSGPCYQDETLQPHCPNDGQW